MRRRPLARVAPSYGRRGRLSCVGAAAIALALAIVAPTVVAEGQQPAPPRPPPPATRAPAGTIELRLEPEAPLVAGGRGTLRLVMRVVPAAGWLPADEAPWIATAIADGNALEVVRPRQTRLDAVDPAAADPVLRFPVVARAAGDAVVRVTASTFVCRVRARARRCRAVTSTSRTTVAVSAAGRAP